MAAVNPKNHPFYAGSHNGHDFFHLTVDDRLRAVQHCTADQCRAALRIRMLQKTVRLAVERRLRQLDKADGGVRDGTDRTTSGWIGQP